MDVWTIDRKPMNPGWSPEETRDKDGKPIQGRLPGDWQAWVKRQAPGARSGYHMLLQFGSEGVTSEKADEIVAAVLDGLNRLAAQELAA